jgi:hypothetical protein
MRGYWLQREISTWTGRPKISLTTMQDKIFLCGTGPRIRPHRTSKEGKEISGDNGRLHLSDRRGGKGKENIIVFS